MINYAHLGFITSGVLLPRIKFIYEVLCEERSERIKIDIKDPAVFFKFIIELVVAIFLYYLFFKNKSDLSKGALIYLGASSMEVLNNYMGKKETEFKGLIN
jgi:hypothetical protein